MPWIEEKKPCQHLDRPEPELKDVGRVWQCDVCGKEWRVGILDHGHDVMPGEKSSEPFWIGTPW